MREVRSLSRYVILYSLKVQYADGKDVPLTLYGKALSLREAHAPREGSLSTRSSAPGEKVVDRISLTDYYDFSLGGKYVVSAKRSVVKSGGNWPPGETISSNKIEFSVDETLELSERIKYTQGRQFPLCIPDFEGVDPGDEMAVASVVQAYHGAITDLIGKERKSRSKEARISTIYLLGELHAASAVSDLVSEIDLDADQRGEPNRASLVEAVSRG